MATTLPFKVYLEGNQGFILNTDVLNTGQLGYLTVDITEYVLSVDVNRGRPIDRNEYNAGQMRVVFDNRTRVFDPQYTASPLYGSIVPKRGIIFGTNRYSPQFTGSIDSWSFDYDVSGNSTATASCSDQLSYLAAQQLNLVSPPAEDPASRIRRVLSSNTVDLEPFLNEYGGVFTLDSTSYSGNALAYIRSIANSEDGAFYVDKYGVFWYEGWNRYVNMGAVYQWGNVGEAYVLPFTEIAVDYGTDLLTNSVVLNSSIGTAIAEDSTSQSTNGVVNKTLDVLNGNATQLQTLANYFVSAYKNSMFRVESVTTSYASIKPGDDFRWNTIALLELDLNRPVQIKFRPNNIGDPYIFYGRIIGIKIKATPSTYDVTVSFIPQYERTPQ